DDEQCRLPCTDSTRSDQCPLPVLCHLADRRIAGSISRSKTLIRAEGGDLVVHKSDRHRMAKVREDYQPVAIVLADALADLPQGQFDLALVHAEDDLMRIDSLPDLRAPVLVELVWIVVEEDLVGVEGILPGLAIADGDGVLFGRIG